jgi:hypothetical protein
VTDRDAYSEFERALARLDELRDSVAQQTNAEAVFETLRALQLAVVRSYGGRRPHSAAGRGSPSRMLEHLRQHLGEWVAGEELAAVAGVREWGRRVRVLRQEQGYRIEERDGAYRLIDAEPDAVAAKHWRTLSAIRRRGGPPKARAFTLLSSSVGDVVLGAELSYVAGGRDAARLVHELRDEDERLPIDSALDCRDLQGDEFRLVSLDPEDRRDDCQRLFPEAVRADVFRRDDYTCWRCRRDRPAALACGDSAFYLEIHHLQADAEALDRLPIAELTDPAALATYCHKCLLDERTAERRRSRQTGLRPDSGQ